MIIVHHLNNSRSQRVLWLLEELDLGYKIKFYERDPKTGRAPKSLKAVHPLGRSPVIEHGKNIIAETGAIIEYIIDEKAGGRLRPKRGTKEFLLYTHFLHYGEGSAMFPLLLAQYAGFLHEAGKPLHSVINREMKTHFDYIEYHLTANRYFAGDKLSGADIQMLFPLEAAKTHGRLVGYEACIDFVNRMHKRPAYLRAIERGGHYDYGPH